MMKFASFETIVAAIYDYLPGSKSDYNKGAQTGVAFVGGYLAGILCAIVSHPADVMVSKLNADRGAGEGFGAAVSRIYGKIGFAGLWNGLPVRIVSLPPIEITQSRWKLIAGDLGDDWNIDRFAMDDLRLVQDLYGSADNGRRRRQENCKGLKETEGLKDDELVEHTWVMAGSRNQFVHV